MLTKCAIFILIFDSGAVALVSSQSAPECTTQSLMIIRMSQATSFNRSIARKLAAVVICFMHFATTPSTNLSIPLSLRDFPLPLRPSEKERGKLLYRIHGGNSNADPGAVALVSSQNAPEHTTQSLMIIRILQAVSS